MYKGYYFFPDGTHTEAVNLNNPRDAVKYAMLQKDIQHEVKIVDEKDYTVLHTIKGEIIFPKNIKLERILKELGAVSNDE